MSSATSIDSTRAVNAARYGHDATADRRRRGGSGQSGDEPDASANAPFRVWHFFVLLSLVAATVAVVMARQATPEHLILLSLTIGAAGAAGIGFYRMLAPLAATEGTIVGEPISESTRAALEREKALVLRSIKELEFDRAMGKVSPQDFDEMAGRLRARALTMMRQLDQGGAYRELIEKELQARIGRSAGKATAPAAVANASACRSCGTNNDHDAAFCKKCGANLKAQR